MALKKSQLYFSLWQGCDELRGGRDASQYNDYILTLLFMKHVLWEMDSLGIDPFHVSGRDKRLFHSLRCTDGPS